MCEGEQPSVILLMGVSGSGKTTIGRLLAQRLGCDFIDADDLHSEANVLKMSAGKPLDDTDRWPWLQRVREVIDQHARERLPAVIACSALKHSYRERLGVGTRGGPRLVYLRASQPLLAAHLQDRSGHFMPATLLDSQLSTLEEPHEEALVLDVDRSPREVAAGICRALGLS